MPPFILVIAKRVVRMVAMIWLIATAVFFAGRSLPSDPVTATLGPGLRDPDTVRALRHSYGLDAPLASQYANFLVRLPRGQFGLSLTTGVPVKDEIGARLPVSLLLAGLAFVFACLFGLPMGGYLVSVAGTRRDATITAALAAVHSVPVYVLGIGVLYLFSYRLAWFPVLGGRATTQSWILPVTTLGISLGAYLARLTRQTVLGLLPRLNLLALHSFGIPARWIWLGHILRNAAPSVVTTMSIVLAYALAGNMLLEAVFSMRGVGQLLARAVLNRDYPLLQGVAIWIATAFLLLNLTAEIVALVLDPRIRGGYAAN